MPYWEIFTPENAYTEEDKQQLSADLTKVYVDFVDLPEFYVVIRFQEMPENTMYVGGQPKNNFVRIVVDHIARQMDDPEFRKLAMSVFEATIAPYVRDRGYDWEIHIDETAIDLWRVQGLMAPPENSDMEKLWAKENRPIPYDEDTMLPLEPVPAP
jgi:phenylpyruvate tautomerase PptA (4-oxalocrotonate tautomerase family)